MMRRKDPDKKDVYLYKRGRRWWAGVHVPKRGWVRFACRPAGETMATADKRLAEVIARRRRELLLGRPTTRQLPRTIEDWIRAFQADSSLAGRQAQARYNASVARRFADERDIAEPAEITYAAISAYLSDLRRGGAALKTVWNHRGGLSSFCEFLTKVGELESNPVGGIKLASPRRRPARFLTAREIEATLAAAAQVDGAADATYRDLRRAIILVLMTGLRMGELRRLRWADVDLPNKRLLVCQAKGDRFRVVWLNSRAITVLETLAEAGTDGYVFPGRIRRGASGMRKESWFREAFRPIQDAVPAFTEGTSSNQTGRAWHLLRHTFASRAIQNKVTLAQIRDWLGHVDIRTTDIYAHLAPRFDPDIEKVR